jgi:adenosyl cobinamide kinase/adenosyl cobinamide phosphate guanylyltransferase
MSCATMRSKLSSLLTEAQVCSVAANAKQCTGFVENECGCPVPVNKPESEVTAQYTDLVARLNKECSTICAAVLCVEPTSATCSTQGSQAMGHCVASGLGTNPGRPGQGP